MKRLTDDRITDFKNYLRESGLGEALLPELLDHLACEAEERLWEGQSLEKVIENLRSEIDPDTLKQLSSDHKDLLAMEDSLNDIVFVLWVSVCLGAVVGVGIAIDAVVSDDVRFNPVWRSSAITPCTDSFVAGFPCQFPPCMDGAPQPFTVLATIAIGWVRSSRLN